MKTTQLQHVDTYNQYQCHVFKETVYGFYLIYIQNSVNLWEKQIV